MTSVAFCNKSHHCLKIVQIRTVFSFFQSVFSCIWTRKSVFGHFSCIMNQYETKTITNSQNQISLRLVSCTFYAQSSSPLEVGCASVPFSGRNLPNHLEFLLEIAPLSIKSFQKYFDTLNFQKRNICGLAQIQFLTGDIWWSMSTKSCLIFSTFCFYLFVYLIFCFVLNVINYFSFIFSYSTV